MKIELTENQIIALRMHILDNKNTVTELLESGIVSILQHPNLKDVREKGCFCAACGEYSKVKGMLYEKNVVRWYRGQPYICNSGYDGCNGWD